MPFSNEAIVHYRQIDELTYLPSQQAGLIIATLS
jgi:hypothetical protein